jgi:hypothetical protein
MNITKPQSRWIAWASCMIALVFAFPSLGRELPTFSATIGPLYERHGIHAGISTTDTPLHQMMRKLAELPLASHPGALS